MNTRLLLRWLAPALVVLCAALSLRAETLPPAPAAYFNDYAGIVSSATAQTLNARLEQFERDTSNQIVVAIFPRMDSASSVEDYTVRVAESWKVGQKGRDNGAVLFVFVASHQLYIQVGYGLEGALPDATCKAIIDREITPRFRDHAYDSGLTAAVTAMIAATKGEYHGTGRTQAEWQPFRQGAFPWVPVVIFLLILIGIVIAAFSPQARTYRASRSSRNSGWWTGGGGGFGGGSFGGGGGGGGFSGGGGSFGGGGAGGSW